MLYFQKNEIDLNKYRYSLIGSKGERREEGLPAPILDNINLKIYKENNQDLARPFIDKELQFPENNKIKEKRNHSKTLVQIVNTDYKGFGKHAVVLILKPGKNPQILDSLWKKPHSISDDVEALLLHLVGPGTDVIDVEVKDCPQQQNDYDCGVYAGLLCALWVSEKEITGNCFKIRPQDLRQYLENWLKRKLTTEKLVQELHRVEAPTQNTCTVKIDCTCKVKQCKFERSYICSKCKQRFHMECERPTISESLQSLCGSCSKAGQVSTTLTDTDSNEPSTSHHDQEISSSDVDLTNTVITRCHSLKCREEKFRCYPCGKVFHTLCEKPQTNTCDIYDKTCSQCRKLKNQPRGN